MAKILLLIALCVLPALVSATRGLNKPLTVQGFVHCDRCRAGFETPKTRTMAGAKVKLECRDRVSSHVVYRKEGYTDSTGQYNIPVNEDHLDQVCDAILVKSSQPDCAEMSPGRERARVVLTNYNGLASTTRYANALHFLAAQPDSGCTEIMKLYQEDEENL
ncbi:Pollen Ole e 1 allergen/extensin [Corchorus capsularis]|uniref:Pollen Ole e 1 allergen/extensin n=1 Tax=Corchorus capsularis TaxID=210143 RepID=A0A1R3ITB1_COCAP|nr:Pollen Ole e 1 allergen/extensin [Corchorus capsularis]